jgi:AraC-like DNA-binding protein
MWAIKDLAVKLGISQKHLISMFSNKVGLAPKAFSRISKFQKVIHQLESIKRIEWTWIATDCGYYDQSHFIKEFSEFSGVNPSEYLTQRGEYINYLPVTGF